MHRSDTSSGVDGVAVIGMSCHFPGAKNVDEFWHNLRNGVESVTFFSDQELRDSGIDSALINDPNYVKAGCVIEDIDLFDATFFGYSPKEAETIDPQQRLFLECAWEAIEDAGYVSQTYEGLIGVFGGARMSSYVNNMSSELSRAGTASGFQALIGNDKDYITTRVSYKLNLRGPSVAVQSACSTSLVAVHLACESLRNGECDMALAGGAAISVPQKQGYFYQEGMIFSPDGHCRAFDASAQGIIGGNGVGIVLLKRLSDALADGDHIYAVIRGSAVNNDGWSKVGYTAPSLEGQTAVISEALAMEDIQPETITYIEAHGTGTEIGDPMEVEALTRVFRSNTDKKGFCAIGSVKTNFGHLDTAAGVASLIKTVLALKYKQLPPSLHFEKPNPRIDFPNSPFFVNPKLSKWKVDGYPRRAGVSSFGIGGTNAHVVLEEAPAPRPADNDIERPLHLMTLSARSKNALQELARGYEAFMETHPDASVPDICFTANVGRSHFPYRLAVASESTKQLREQMSTFASGIKSTGLVSAHVQSGTNPRVAFLFTGQGSQYVGMGQQLYYTQPTFRKALDRCAEILRIHLDHPLLSIIFENEGDSSILDETAYTQPALFALEYALAEMWRSWGIEPSVVMGHSIGEYVAACVAGVFSLEHGLKLIAARGRLIQALPHEGEMAAIFAGEERVAVAVASYADEVSIAAINGPENMVISGVRKTVRKILEELASEGIRAVHLKVSHAFHSPLMEPMLSPFEKITSEIEYSTPQIGLISNVTGRLVKNNEVCKASYWRRHVRNPVRFELGMKTLHEQECELFLEIGPSPILLGMGRRCLPEGIGVWLPSLRKERSDWEQLLKSLGDLYVRGVDVDWSGFDQDYSRRRMSLPTYPFERKRYWFEKASEDHYRVAPTGAEMWDSLIEAGQMQSHHGISELKLDEYSANDQNLRRLYAAYATLALQSFGAFQHAKDRYSVEILLNRFPIQPRYRQLLFRLLEGLVEEGQLQRDGDMYENLIPIQIDSINGLVEEAKAVALFSENTKVIEFVQRCGENLGDVLVGKENPMEVIFPHGSFDMVESLYQDNSLSRYYNFILREIVQKIVRSLPLDNRLSILEIGAGTGSTTASLLPVLPPDRTTYIYTDVSPIFLNRAKAKFRKYPFVEYKMLDIQKTLGEQGFETNRFDVVIAANVLHAAHNLNEAMFHVRSLLASEGILLIREITSNTLMFDITFGSLLTELTDEELRGNWPFMSAEKWTKLIESSDFSAVGIFPETGAETEVLGEHIFMARTSSKADGSLAFGRGKLPLQLAEYRRAVPANHPLLGWKLDSPLDDVQFETRLGPDLQPFLQDHRIFGMIVVPGTVFFEMPVAAALEFFKTSSVVLEEITIREALVIPDKGVQTAQFILSPESSNKAAFKIFSREETEEVDRNWRLNAQGYIRIPEGNPVESELRLEEIQARCREKISVKDFYEEIAAESDLFFGAGFQGLKHLWAAEEKGDPNVEGLGEIELPQGLSSIEYRIHPVLLDACLQVSLAVILDKGIRWNKDVIYMPVGADRFRIFRNCPDRLWCYCKIMSDGESSLRLNYYTTNFYLFDSDGQLIAEIVGLHSRQASRQALERTLTRGKVSHENFYKIAWEIKAPDSTMQKGPEQRGNWLIFSDRSDVGAGFLKWAQSRGDTATMVFADTQADISGSSVRQIDPLNSDDFMLLFQQIQNTEKQPLKGVIYLWGLDIKDSEDPKIRVSREFSYGGMLHLVQAMNKTGTSVRLCVLIQNVWSVRPGETTVNGSLLWGLCKVIANEHPDFAPLIVDIDEADKEIITDIGEALLSRDKEREIVLRKGVCYVPRLVPVFPKANIEDIKPNPDATYLITGGLGGMGLELTRWLVQIGARHIVLVGRSAVSKNAKTRLEELERDGAEIIVWQADVSRLEALKEVFKMIQLRMPPLQGVFHLAGVLEERPLLEESMETIKKVMAPKVDGSWNLHLLSKDMNLDFFMMFSSTASLIGGQGQAGYTAANTFLDALAQYRRTRGLPGLSINWGAFAEVGMIAQDRQGTKLREKYGLRAFRPQEVLSYLNLAIRQDEAQLCVADIRWADFSQLFVTGSEPAFFSYLIKTKTEKFAESGDFLNRLHNASPKQRMELLIDFLKQKVAEVLRLNAYEISPEDGLIQLGVDSLIFLDLAQILSRTLQIRVKPNELFEDLTIQVMAERFEKDLTSEESAGTDITEHFKIIPDVKHRHLPFELTDVQHAYWIGRSTALEMGNVSCHAYSEVDIRDLDIDRYSYAWQRLIERHEMLRMVVLPDGQQQILEQTALYQIEVQDFRGKSSDEIQAGLQAIRHRMSSQKLDPGKWPLFEARVSQIDEHHYRIHVDIDMLMVDIYSYALLMQELITLYYDPHTNLPPLELSFRDYVRAESTFRKSELYRQSRDYWMKQLPTLPPGPELPLAKNPRNIESSQFVRRTSQLDAETWARLKNRAAQAGLTSSAVLLSAYAEILSTWSKEPRFCINMTLFNRLPVHPQVNAIVGDFTSVIPLEVDYSRAESFKQFALNVQKQLWEVLTHRYFSGVQVQREINRVKKSSQQISIFPVVFTSALGLGFFERGDDPLTQQTYGISQTPQVWIDHQAFEWNGMLKFNWDALEEIFPEGLLDDMFEAYCRFLTRLVDEESAWLEERRCLLPEAQIEKRKAANATKADMPSEMLHTLFAVKVSEQPTHTAIIGADLRLTYEELFQRANNLGHLLREKGASPNTLVAVIMEKGWEQVVAVIGILQAGAAYLPIDSSVPPERLRHFLKDSEVYVVLTQSRIVDKIEWPGNIELITVDTVKLTATKPIRPVQGPNDLAYVIYTSGSTGFPKGVMIDHRGAVNTILDINRRFGIGPEDRVLALSDLSFDLSVYDIFGTLAAGGCIVIPEVAKRREPVHWMGLMARERITVWNSVPAMMRMLVEYATGFAEIPDSLRLIMLSGDWISLGLPSQIHHLIPNAEIVSLGGATEASIWSILYSIEGVSPQWESIPYGRPMANQRFYVLNTLLEECPEWVVGQLYIGGVGLSRGYWKDDKRTKASFIKHPFTGERLYRTGDLGRYLPDGHIELHGREDFQIKIRGYRVELGEIEMTMKRHSGVRDSVVKAVDETQGDKRLIGYIVPEPDSSLFEIRTKDSERIEKNSEVLTEAGRRATQREREPVKEFINLWQSLDHLYDHSVIHLFQNLGFFKQAKEAHTVDHIMAHGGIVPRYRRWIERSLRRLTEMKLLLKRGDIFENFASFEVQPLDEITQDVRVKNWKAMKTESPLGNEEIDVMIYSAKNLSDFLRERVHSAQIYTSEHILVHYDRILYYINNIIVALVRVLARQLAGKRILRIIEIGGGHAGPTRAVLPILPPQDTIYYFTDISEYFLQNARRDFEEKYPFVKYGYLDLEKPPTEQGYPNHSFDMVIASNMVHDTRDIREALRHLLDLLTPSGLLIMVEHTVFHRSYDLGMGLQQGFDRFKDTELRTQNHPLLSREQWKTVMADMGFEGFEIFNQAGSMDDFQGLDVIINRAPSSIKLFRSDRLSDFLKNVLPDYMVPSDYLLMDNFPMTANNKVDRKAIPIPGRMKTNIRRTIIQPRTSTEKVLAEIWKSILQIDRIGVHDNFFELGGDSLLATQVMVRIRKELGVEVSVQNLYESPVFSTLADMIEKTNKGETSPIVALQPQGYQRPFFCFHAGTGSLFGYQSLAYLMGPDIPVYGFRFVDASDKGEVTIEGLASEYVRIMYQKQTTGPYRLIGFCMGGYTAYEAARQLEAAGEIVQLLVLIDSGYLIPRFTSEEEMRWLGAFLMSLSIPLEKMGLEKLWGEQARIMSPDKSLPKGFNPVLTYDEMERKTPEERLQSVFDVARSENYLPFEMDFKQFSFMYRSLKSNVTAMTKYHPRPFQKSAIYFRAKEPPDRLDYSEFWRKMFPESGLKIYDIPGDHFTMMEEKNARFMVEIIKNIV